MNTTTEAQSIAVVVASVAFVLNAYCGEPFYGCFIQFLTIEGENGNEYAVACFE